MTKKELIEDLKRKLDRSKKKWEAMKETTKGVELTKFNFYGGESLGRLSGIIETLEDILDDLQDVIVDSTPSKKSDLENFIDLYKSLGIDLKVIENSHYKIIELAEDDIGEGCTTHKSFKGFCSFYTKIVFDFNGKYISQGFYEA